MSSAPTPQVIWNDARWLAQAVDPNAGLVRLVDMTPDAYRDAAFLDDRMFEKPRVSHLLQWNGVAAGASADARRDARWIFHIGHVGSTLIARMLGELDGVLAVREPRALRDLTFFPADVRARFVPPLQALLSRTFGAHQKALVKATSFVNEIAAELVPEGERALFLYTAPRSYIAGILAGENSRKELTGLADTRRQRLAGRGVDLPLPRNEAELAAAAWACEMTALETASGRGALVHWADFDALLQGMELALVEVGSFFSFAFDAADMEAIVAGPLMRRYSKATEYEYSPDLRRELLADATVKHGRDIDSALAMLAAGAETAPLLRKALDRAEAES